MRNDYSVDNEVFLFNGIKNKSLVRGFTLVELILAISLLGVIVLGAATFDKASHYFLRSSERKARILNELNYIWEHLHKNIVSAEGNVNDPGIVTSGNRLRLKEGNRWVEYRILKGSSNLEFCSQYNITTNSCEVNYETLSSRVMNENIFYNSTFANQVIVSNLILRFNPTQGFDPKTNPEVNMGNIIFTSLAHSIN